MQETPCKLHLTLLEKDSQCPVCKWPAGDHPTHPTNRERVKYNEASDLRAERGLLADFLSCIIKSKPEAFISIRKDRLERVAGTLVVSDDGSSYGLRWEPPTMASGGSESGST